MSGATGVIAGAAIAGVGASIYEGNKAAGAAQNASNSSISEQQREYNQTRADQAPGRITGGSALDSIAKLYGLDSVDAHGNVIKGSGKADLSSFSMSPDFQFDLGQGQDAIDRSAAARGGLLSGAAVKQGAQYASGLASQQFGNYVNRLSSVAGIGQVATQATDAAGANAANSISNAYINAGNARASAYDQSGQTIGNTVNGLASNYALYKYLNPGVSGNTYYAGNSGGG